MKQRLAQLLSVLFLVSVFSGMPAGASADRSVLLTFTGDCTLGSEEAKRVNDNSFDSVVGREGLSYPFEKVRFLFEADDLTVVNLEGVLSDSASPGGYAAHPVRRRDCLVPGANPVPPGKGRNPGCLLCGQQLPGTDVPE